MKKIEAEKLQVFLGAILMLLNSHDPSSVTSEHFQTSHPLQDSLDCRHDPGWGTVARTGLLYSSETLFRNKTASDRSQTLLPPYSSSSPLFQVLPNHYSKFFQTAPFCFFFHCIPLFCQFVYILPEIELPL